jgi:hypothetical protein
VTDGEIVGILGPNGAREDHHAIGLRSPDRGVQSWASIRRSIRRSCMRWWGTAPGKRAASQAQGGRDRLYHSFYLVALVVVVVALVVVVSSASMFPSAAEPPRWGSP